MTQRQRTCEPQRGLLAPARCFRKLWALFCSSFFVVRLAFAEPTQLTAVWFLPCKASTIWCFTTDSEVTWQECQPIGVLRPACKHGFLSAVGEPARINNYQHIVYSLYSPASFRTNIFQLAWNHRVFVGSEHLRVLYLSRHQKSSKLDIWTKIPFLPSHLSCSFVGL